MAQPLILASASDIRRRMLEQVGLHLEVRPAAINETALKKAMLGKNLPADIVAANLAVAKAKEVSDRERNALVIGADQALVLNDTILSKPRTPSDAMDQLKHMQGTRHTLISAAAVFENATLRWQVSDTVELEMRHLSDLFIERYVEEEWLKIRWSVGCYLIEDRGVALFKGIHGDYHTILGLPLFKLLTYLEDRGVFSL